MDAIAVMEQFNTPHILYLVIMEGNGERFAKIGITSYDVSVRFKSERSYKVTEAYEFHCKSGEIARGRESLLMSKLIPYNWHYYPKTNFAGKTECYQVEKFDDILNAINLLFFHQDSSFKPFERIVPIVKYDNDISQLLEDFERLQEIKLNTERKVQQDIFDGNVFADWQKRWTNDRLDEFEQIFVDCEDDDFELEATLSSQNPQWSSVRGERIKSIVVEMGNETITL